MEKGKAQFYEFLYLFELRKLNISSKSCCWIFRTKKSAAAFQKSPKAAAQTNNQLYCRTDGGDHASLGSHQN